MVEPVGNGSQDGERTGAEGRIRSPRDLHSNQQSGYSVGRGRSSSGGFERLRCDCPSQGGESGPGRYMEMGQR